MIRKAYLKRIESRIEDSNDEIESLKEKASKVGKEARVLYEEQLVILAAKEMKAQKRVQELRDSEAQTWGKLKGGVEEAVEELKDAVIAAVSKLRKIA
jgi:hypothetical protein